MSDSSRYISSTDSDGAILDIMPVTDPVRGTHYLANIATHDSEGNTLRTIEVRLTPADLAEHGLYELLRRAGLVPRIATQVIGARSATASEARILQEKRGASLLTMSRTAWDASGRALEYGSHVYRASRYSFELNLSAG